MMLERSAPHAPAPTPHPKRPCRSRATKPISKNSPRPQAEFLEDLRVSLIQMKNGDVMPAREALRAIERELKAERRSGN